MEKYIFGSRNGIHIIDLQKTLANFQEAYNFVKDVSSRGGNILFVGTKRQAQEIVRQEAERCGMFFVNQRWLGGTLTNFQTIRKSTQKLKKLEESSADGSYEAITKKEMLQLERQRTKLDKYFGGIKNMPKLPEAVFIVDIRKESIAFKETINAEVETIAIVDTNCNPDGIDFVIPGNDDAIRAIKLMTTKIADAVLEGKAEAQARMEEEAVEAEEAAKAAEVEEKTRQSSKESDANDVVKVEGQ